MEDADEGEEAGSDLEVALESGELSVLDVTPYVLVVGALRDQSSRVVDLLEMEASQTADPLI